MFLPKGFLFSQFQFAPKCEVTVGSTDHLYAPFSGDPSKGDSAEMHRAGLLGVLFFSATCQRASAFAGLSPLRLAHVALPRGAGIASLSAAPRLLRNSHSRPLMMRAAAIAPGDLVAVKWGCTTADGKALPESAQVFDQGSVRLVVGEGGYLPCLHKRVAGMKEGEVRAACMCADACIRIRTLVRAPPLTIVHARVLVTQSGEFEVPPAEAFGESNPMMGPVDLPATTAPAGLEAGMVVQLSNGAKARVTKVTEDAITIDANAPLAGETLKLNIQVESFDPGATSLERADFALGCFWGAELAFQVPARENAHNPVELTQFLRCFVTQLGPLGDVCARVCLRA